MTALEILHKRASIFHLIFAVRHQLLILLQFVQVVDRRPAMLLHVLQVLVTQLSPFGSLGETQVIGADEV
mgnify:CR=1 FL=1